MSRYLVVANQTLGGRHLEAEIRKRIDAGDATFHVLVPATQPSDHLTWTEGEVRSSAQERLDQAIARIGEIGGQASGEVGDARPLDAIRDAMPGGPFDEIILSTLPQGVSRWLRQDLPHRVERAFGIPVTHVVSEQVDATG